MTMWHPQLEGTPVPRYLAIADALERDVRAGTLLPGDPLPTHRDLAERLGVTVGTVTRGYGEAIRRGLVRGETGRGTFVSTEPVLISLFEQRSEEMIEMGLNLPLEAFSPDLASTLATLSKRGDLQQLLCYQEPSGLPHHREAGAAWVGRYGLSAHPDDILICAGAQHALQIAFASLFRAGDRIGVEQFTYPTVKSLARQLELKLVVLQADENGAHPEEVRAACLRHGLRGLFLQPACNNPTTASMPETRRHELAELAERFDLTIVEDDSYGLTVDHGIPPLAARLPQRTAHVAGTSKMLCGGLRIAYLTAPRKWHPRLRRAMITSTWMVAPLMAEVAAAWITDGTAEGVVRAKTVEAEVRNEMMRSVFDGLEFRHRKAGHFLWLHLPEPWRGMELEQVALERGVTLTAGDHFAFGQTPQDQFVRISLSSPGSRIALRNGLRIITDILGESPRGIQDRL